MPRDKARHAIRMKERVTRLLSLGLCSICGSNPLHNKYRCKICEMKKIKQQSIRREIRKKDYRKNYEGGDEVSRYNVGARKIEGRRELELGLRLVVRDNMKLSDRELDELFEKKWKEKGLGI